MIRLGLLIVFVVGCGNSRSVDIKGDNLDIRVRTKDGNPSNAPGEISIIVNAKAIVPVIFIPMPAPYAKACATTAEKP